MNVEVRLVVAWVNSGGPPGMKDAPAWIELPLNMPFYGTKAFRELKLTMFIRKSFLVESKYDQAAIVVAHELSHVVLESIRHPLRGCEKAVDLTAMLLGFRQLYASGSYKEERSGNSTRSRKLGYLSLEEVQLANRILAPGVETRRAALVELLTHLRHGLAVTADALDPATVESIANAARQNLRDPWAISAQEEPRVSSALIIDAPRRADVGLRGEALVVRGGPRSRLARQLGHPRIWGKRLDSKIYLEMGLAST